MPYREAPSGVFRLVQTLPPQPPRTHTHTHRQEAATYHITPVHWTDSLTSPGGCHLPYHSCALD